MISLLTRFDTPARPILKSSVLREQISKTGNIKHPKRCGRMALSRMTNQLVYFAPHFAGLAAVGDFCNSPEIRLARLYVIVRQSPPAIVAGGARQGHQPPMAERARAEVR